jgi:hypothetical protein
MPLEEENMTSEKRCIYYPYITIIILIRSNIIIAKLTAIQGETHGYFY